MKTILASLALALAVAIGWSPAQASPMSHARSLAANAETGTTLIGHRHYRRHRHHSHRHYRPRYYGYRSYGFRPYAYYPRHYYRPYYYPRYRSYSGFSFYIGPRFRHAYYYH